MRLLKLSALLLLISFSAYPQGATPKIISEFDAYVAKAVKDWEVPGLAVVVVKNGEVLFSKGYGVRTLGKDGAVDSKTLFACASTTKAMTAACIGMLVDEGKLDWNDPVIKYLPDFQLYDPFVTRDIKIRDLLVHDTGVGNADFLWGLMDIKSDEILHKMRYVEPSYSLRAGFIYQNIFYLAAGKVVEKVSGKPWSIFIKERIFEPLGMARTFPLISEVKDANQTSPHFKVEGKITVIEHTKADEIGPAGSVWSCVEDMGKWMRVMIDSSKYKGGRLLSAASWTEMFKPQVIVPSGEFYPTQVLTKPNWTTYGLGWFQHDYKGKKINFHTGSLAGAVAIHAQLPEEKLGIYVFGNYDHAEIRHALVYKAFDHFALGGTRDWSAEFLKLYGNIQAGNEKRRKDFEDKRVPNTKPSLPLKDYTGTYTDKLFGTVEVTQEGDQLVAIANKYAKATVSHWHFDTFRGWYKDKWDGKANVSFTIGLDGKVASVNFDGAEYAREGN